MHPTYATDERLKSYLDTNQQHREQLCLSVLAMDKRFSNVRPRHPRGGPDGGRDIEAMYRGDQLAYAAVGFVNQANESNGHKSKANKKFKEDLENAWTAEPRPKVFVFFTNVNLTAGEKHDLVELAKKRGFAECDVFDRERIRIALDSADGFAARFQFLGLPMSEAEQASFFAKWGDDINSVITTGFQQVHSTLAHLLFLQEANRPLDSLHVYFKLDREYTATEINHFRAFLSIYLKEPKIGTLAILFGSCDRMYRFTPADKKPAPDQSGIAHGICLGQWRTPWPEDPHESASDDSQGLDYEELGFGSSIGMKVAKGIGITFHNDSLIRITPTFTLADFDEAMLMPIVNHSLAEKLEHISVYANGYMLLDLPRHAFKIDASEFKLERIDNGFNQQELSDPWVRLRPSNLSSNWNLSFSRDVPVRMFSSRLATEAHKEKTDD